VRPSKESVLERYSFSGHESFPLRFAWLPKGIQGVTHDPEIFTREDAPVTLGVGKNMVASIRHWCLTLNMIEPEGRSGKVKTTSLGHQLFDSDGWDPYLEDIGTLWLLHWLLARQTQRASTWHLAFTQWNATSFTREHLVEWLAEFVRESKTARATLGSLRRDVDVFVRTYVASHATRDLSLEDTFDSPLVELGLIREVEARHYVFTRGSRPSLPTEIFAYALLDFWQHRFAHQRTLSFEAIHFGPGSPGSAFKLSENALAERLEGLPTWSGLTYDETAGTRVVLRQEERSGTHDLSPGVALRHYFGREVPLMLQAVLNLGQING
jgi:hypothetical protein